MEKGEMGKRESERKKERKRALCLINMCFLSYNLVKEDYSVNITKNI